MASTAQPPVSSSDIAGVEATSSRESVFLRLLTALRPEEYLLIVIGCVFAWLHLSGVTTVVFKTTFIRAGWRLFTAFIQLFTVVAAWRAYRLARNEPATPSKLFVGLVVTGPIVVVALFTAEVIRFRWQPAYLDRAWYLVVLLVLAAAAVTTKDARDERAKRLWDFARSMVKDVLHFARAWFPFIALLSTYENALRLVGRVRSSLYDPEMFRLDELLFGGHLDVWFQHIISAPLTEAFAFFYNALYLFPLVVGMTLYLRWRHREFRVFLMAFVVAGWGGYLGYLLVPVIGPRFFYPDLYSIPLSGLAVDGSLRDAAIQKATEAGMRFHALAERMSDRAAYGGQIPRNCFPSLHTAWGVVVLICSYRYVRPLFYLLAIPLLWMIAATSYLRFHYLVDVLAGVLLAIAMVTLMPRVDDAWERMRARARGLTPPLALSPGLKTGFDRFKLAASLGAFVAFSAFVTVYVLRSDAVRQKDALANAVSRDADALDLAPSERIGALFDNGAIELIGARSLSQEWRRGQVVQFELYWRVRQPVSGRWKVFVHLRNGEGRNIANADHHPVGGAYRVRAWKAGDVVKDVVSLRVPDSASGRRLEVWAGFFDEVKMDTRMAVTSASEAYETKGNAVRVLTPRLRAR